MNPNKLLRFDTLLLSLLLSLSAFQIAYAQSPPTRAVNLSTRMFVQTGDRVAIAGFIITGPAGSQKQVRIRALGESLPPIIPNLLHEPTLELQGDPPGFVPIFSNDCPPSVSPDACIETTLAPGQYTATVRGENNGTGVALVEVYDLDATPTPDSRLGNISTRAFVQRGDNIVIAGFILSNGSGTGNIVVRGLGPSLSDFGVLDADELADPTLELRNSNAMLLASNNDWQPGTGIPVNLEPTEMKESALAAPPLQPGQYTALLAGLNNTTGIGTVEVYDLQ